MHLKSCKTNYLYNVDKRTYPTESDLSYDEITNMVTEERDCSKAMRCIKDSLENVEGKWKLLIIAFAAQ